MKALPLQNFQYIEVWVESVVHFTVEIQIYFQKKRHCAIYNNWLGTYKTFPLEMKLLNEISKIKNYIKIGSKK